MSIPPTFLALLPECWAIFPRWVDTCFPAIATWFAITGVLLMMVAAVTLLEAIVTLEAAVILLVESVHVLVLGNCSVHVLQNRHVLGNYSVPYSQSCLGFLFLSSTKLGYRSALCDLLPSTTDSDHCLLIVLFTNPWRVIVCMRCSRILPSQSSNSQSLAFSRSLVVLRSLLSVGAFC